MGKRTHLMPISVLVFLLFSVSDALALDKVRFGTSVRTARQELLLIAAEERGLWKQNGLEVNWISFRSGSELYQGMGGRSVDLGLVSANATIQSIARGLPAIIVAQAASKEDFGIWVPRDSPIKGPKDLRGAKVAITRFGGIEHAYGQMVAKNLGLGKELKLVAMGGILEALAALKSGVADARIDDILRWIPLKHKGEVREVLSLKEYFPSPWIFLAVSGRIDFTESNPDSVRRGVKAFFQSAAFVLQNRPWAVEKLKRQYGFSDEVAQDVYNILEFAKEARIDGRAVENLRNFLLEYGLLAKDTVPPLERLYTNKFAE